MLKKTILDFNFSINIFDKFQKEAIFSKHKTSLINAGAGSGKTTTIIGRIIYLLADKNVSPEEILVLTFNNSVAKEIRLKIKVIAKEISKNKNLLKEYPSLDIKLLDLSTDDPRQKRIHTFHSFCLSELKLSKIKYHTSKMSSRNTFQLNNVYKDLLTNRRINDLVRVFFINQIEPINIFKDIENFNDYKIKVKPRKKTLKGYDVKSNEELEIANYFLLKGINFEYEKARDYGSGVAYPDFHLFKKDDQNNIEYDVYLEHFALDKNFKAPSYFDEEKKGGKQEYEDNYFLKIQTMKDDGKDLISTFSYQFADRKIFDFIDKELEIRGIKPDEVDIEKSVELFRKSQESSYLLECLNTATSLFKLNELSILALLEASTEDVKKAQKDVDKKLDEVKKKSNKEKKEDLKEQKITNKNILTILFEAIFSFKKNEPLFKKRDYDPNMHLIAFIEIFSFFFKQYQEKLKGSVPQNFKGIDYDDQIILGCKYIEKEFKRNIKHLIVDEFQDISNKRSEIIRNVEKKCQSKLFLVGDDWQSINSFSGSNVKLMLSSFQKIFGDHKKINLNYTYRFNDKTCKLTKRFVEQDEDLQKKDLKSYKGTLPEYEKWNDAVPLNIISLPNIRNLELGSEVYVKKRGYGIIKGIYGAQINDKEIEKKGYKVKLKKTNKIGNFEYNEIETFGVLDDSITVDIIKKLDLLKNKNKEVLFLTRLRINTYNYKNLNENLITYLKKIFSLKEEKNRSGNLILRGEMFKKITFMTVHGAKGLEADIVFILRMYDTQNEFPQGFPFERKEDSLLKPFYKLSDYVDVREKEERRLFYVALTRAKQKTIVYTDPENRFIEKIKSLNEEGIDYNYEFLKSKTSSRNKNKLLNLKKEINTSLNKDYSAENHIENIKSKTLTCTIDIEKWVNFIYHEPSVKEFFAKKDLTKLIDLHKKRLLFINNHSLRNGSQFIGQWYIDRQTRNPTIKVWDWLYDIGNSSDINQLFKKRDLDADLILTAHYLSETITYTEVLQTGNCLISGNGCFINSDGTCEYGYWFKDSFIKNDDEQQDILLTNLDILNSGNFYKFEDKDTFTPFNKKMKKSFDDFKKEVSMIRAKNFAGNFLVNKGLPFTNEEFSHAKKFLDEGAKASTFRRYFERSIVTISLYFIRETNISLESIIKKLFKNNKGYKDNEDEDDIESIKKKN